MHATSPHQPSYISPATSAQPHQPSHDERERILCNREGLQGSRRVATTEMGSNDAGCIIWALGEFFIYICVFLILNDKFRCYRGFKCTEGLLEGDSDSNGPKQCQTRRLGPRWVFFFLCSFLILNDIYSMEGSPRASSKVTRMIMGPNGAKCVVWAHGEYFFLLSLSF